MMRTFCCLLLCDGVDPRSNSANHPCIAGYPPPPHHLPSSACTANPNAQEISNNYALPSIGAREVKRRRRVRMRKARGKKGGRVGRIAGM